MADGELPKGFIDLQDIFRNNEQEQVLDSINKILKDKAPEELSYAKLQELIRDKKTLIDVYEHSLDITEIHEKGGALDRLTTEIQTLETEASTRVEYGKPKGYIDLQDTEKNKKQEELLGKIEVILKGDRSPSELAVRGDRTPFELSVNELDQVIKHTKALVGVYETSPTVEGYQNALDTNTNHLKDYKSERKEKIAEAGPSKEEVEKQEAAKARTEIDAKEAIGNLISKNLKAGIKAADADLSELGSLAPNHGGSAKTPGAGKTLK